MIQLGRRAINTEGQRLGMKLSAESEHGPAPTFSWRRAPDRGEVAPPIAAKSRRKAGAILSPESRLKIAPVFRRIIIINTSRRKAGTFLSLESRLKIAPVFRRDFVAIGGATSPRSAARLRRKRRRAVTRMLVHILAAVCARLRAQTRFIPQC